MKEHVSNRHANVFFQYFKPHIFGFTNSRSHLQMRKPLNYIMVNTNNFKLYYLKLNRIERIEKNCSNYFYIKMNLDGFIMVSFYLSNIFSKNDILQFYNALLSFLLSFFVHVTLYLTVHQNYKTLFTQNCDKISSYSVEMLLKFETYQRYSFLISKNI